MTLLQKLKCRDLTRSLRRFIDPAYREKASHAAAQHFVQSSFFKDHQHIACYYPLPDEIDTTPIIQALHQQQKSCYLPLISADPMDKTLHFALYQKEARLSPNHYQVLEPQDSSAVLLANELDLVIVPLLAFDDTGTRLGTGGGFYDYTFSFLIKSRPCKPLLIGLAYEIQHVAQLPRESFDVTLDGVVTEEKIRLFSSLRY